MPAPIQTAHTAHRRNACRFAGCAALWLAWCTVGAQSLPPLALVPAFSAMAPGAVPAPWHFATLPRKTPTEFQIVELEGQRVLRAHTQAGYGNLVLPLAPSSTPPQQLRWRWRVDQLVDNANLRQRAGDDAPLKLCVAFDFDKNQLSWGERAKLRLGQISTGEPIPAETLCYVWDKLLPVGTLLHNAFTHRLRYIVLQSGSAHLGQWQGELRNVAADYARAFGDESPQGMPALVDLVISADADNTQSEGLGYVGDIQLLP